MLQLVHREAIGAESGGVAASFDCFSDLVWSEGHSAVVQLMLLADLTENFSSCRVLTIGDWTCELFNKIGGNLSFV